MKIYLKLFFAAAIPYTVALSLLFRAPLLGLVLGLSFGALIAGVFGTLQVRSMEGKKRSDESYAVRQTREFEVDRPLDEALKLAKAAIESLDGTKVMKEASIRLTGHPTTTIEARTGLNWETYGEKITLRAEAVDADTTVIRIESRPRLRTTLIDYGRNLHHVNAISQYIREHTATDHLRLSEDDADDEPYSEALVLETRR